MNARVTDADGPTWPLSGRVALVTGGTRGLGRAIAHKLASWGCHSIVNYAHSDGDAAAVVESLQGLPGSATVLKADVSRPDEVRRLLDRVRSEHGRLDLLIHNAATFHPMPALAPSPQVFEREQALAMNLFLHGGALLRELLTRGGRVIVISSNGAHEVIPGYVSVGVAKAALESMVRYLAVELAPDRITVNGVSTSLLDKGAESAARTDLIRMLARRSPAGRLTAPEDVADAVVLLCTPEAGWIQGQILTVDGGLSLVA